MAYRTALISWLLASHRSRIPHITRARHKRKRLTSGLLGATKKGVSTIYCFSPCPFYTNMYSCLGQWSATCFMNTEGKLEEISTNPPFWFYRSSQNRDLNNCKAVAAPGCELGMLRPVVSLFAAPETHVANCVLAAFLGHYTNRREPWVHGV